MMCQIVRFGFVLSFLLKPILPAPYSVSSENIVTKISLAVCQYKVDKHGWQHLTKCVRTNIPTACPTLPINSSLDEIVMVETWRVYTKTEYLNGKVLNQNMQKVGLCSRRRIRRGRIVDDKYIRRQTARAQNPDFLLPLADGAAVCSKVDF